jgi:predicted dehydrogenase
MKLRGAISGFGEVAAKAHLVGWLTRTNINIGAIHDPIAERRHEAIRLIRNVRVYDDLELMLDGEALDFVDIASPPALHAKAARLALEAGAHVLVEKPLCLSLDEFDELAKLARAKDRVLMCVHNWKYAPSYALARRIIDEGRIGAVSALSLERLRTAPAGAGGAGGRWRSSGASGGGILIDHGWHIFYLMQWLMNEEPRGISARLVINGAGVEEVADLRVSFPSGRFANANLSWQAAARRTSATVVGENGRLEIESDRVTLTSRQGQAQTLPVHDVPDDSYHSVWFSEVARRFEEAVAEGARSPAAQQNQREARSAVALITSARLSSKNGGITTNIAA